MEDFLTINNLDLFSVGLAIAASMILGFMVFFSDQRSSTNRAFLFFAVMTSVWGTFNYLNQTVENSLIAFWLLRLSIFFATWHAFSLFHLLYVIPKPKFIYPSSYYKIFLPIVILCSFLTLTPFIFDSVSRITDGKITEVVNGPGIIFFATIILALVVGGIYNLIIKIRQSQNHQRSQLLTILGGLSVTFLLILVFNFAFPAFLKNSSYTPLGAVFIFPFLLAAGYAIVKQGILNVKVASAEFLVFVLAVVTLFEVILSKDPLFLAFRISQFILVMIFGILLVNSIVKDVKQREELQTLTSALEDTNTKLQNLDQARSDFITIASHQSRTPPTTIKWYLAAIRAGDYGNVEEQLKVALSKAEAVNNSLISLIDDLLNASRIERGKMEFVFEPTDLTEIVKAITEQLQPLASIKKLKLELHLPKQLPPLVIADREKIRQVVNNFVDNAIKYSNTGTIEVSLKESSGSVSVEVTDNGKGFAEETGKTLFHKYTRGQDAAVHSTGLGLGLYVAKVVIDKHNGQIWAKSPGEGKGATFGFSLLVNNNLPQHASLNLAPAENLDS